MPTLFIAGATGYTGQALVRLARNAGHQVVAHIREDSARRTRLTSTFEAAGARVAVTSWEPEAIATAVADAAPTHVFSLLGTTAAQAAAAAKRGERADYETVDLGMTQMVVQATAHEAPNARFIYLSSAGADASRRNAYLDARWRIESQLAASDLDWTVARPSFITGADRDDPRWHEQLGAAVVDTVASWLGALGAGSVADPWRSITAERLASALLVAGVDSPRPRQTIDAATLHQLTHHHAPGGTP